ncbi:PhzF family phenazine biosynthesis protein [Antrihabitans sp. YC2-6]|uniref:PhzF family phenazine biosynthesis protein n=1 Tax=Antrihabitans sp. YC2-6 TaxID=2799498 RepID=UPI0018F53893|nr:PhzF family phenazine biosynthesis protein [Antrihabitans sp. YC2-6]MBJ8345038.1 PhzF family phenazine biosynthesis protein [Antrihabitans sp. YC2-6]
MAVDVAVVRVFTSPSGEFGNALGIVSALAVPEADRQTLAAQLGFSETVFVELTADAPIARVQIFTPATELPFAGHPSVGLGWWLDEVETPVDALDVPAGRVAVTRTNGLTKIRAQADWAPAFEFHDLASAADVDALNPTDFRSGHHYAWAWTDRSAGAIRSRMFAPDMGIAEDEATGAAAVRITARLQRDLTITQGRGSQIFTTVLDEDWIQLGGRCVAERSLQV